MVKDLVNITKKEIEESAFNATLNKNDIVIAYLNDDCTETYAYRTMNGYKSWLDDIDD